MERNNQKIMGAQTTTLVIDNFKVSQPALIIVSTTSFPSILFSTEETASTDILGNERDLQLTMTGGTPNVIATASVSSGTFTTSIGKGGEGYALLQYDGIDGSMNLNTTGLTSVPGASLGLNLLSNGGALFNFTYISNYDIEGTVYVYDVDSGVSYLSLTFSATNNKISTIFGSFDDFEGFCDLSKVGAIEFFFEVADFNEFLLYQIVVITSFPPTPPPPPFFSTSVLMIDDVKINQPEMIVETTANPIFPISSSSFEDDATLTHILGGERDIQLTVTGGGPYDSASVQVHIGELNYQSVDGLSDNILVQYDGEDHSINLNKTGLTSIPGASNGLDLTNNNGKAFNFSLVGFPDFGVSLNIYDINGGVCNFLYNNAGTHYFPIYPQIPFSSLMGNCNLKQVGAIEFFFEAYGQVDLEIYEICVVN